MSRIAVIGAGIAGLSAAYFLSRKHEVWLFEKEERLGGHTHTHSVNGLNIDTGFIVYNEVTYPNLIRLFAELGVETQVSDMSFSVFDPASGFSYSSNGLGGFFCDRRNWIRPGHYKLGLDILRFNREAGKLLESGEDITLGDYLRREGFSRAFQDLYLFPMASAIWSTSLGQVKLFPALTLVRFFANHNLLSVNQHHTWRAVKGGSSSYIEPISRPFRERAILGATIESIGHVSDGIEIHMASGNVLKFDEVVFACRAGEALRLLKSPIEKEREILGSFQTSLNQAWLHTDETLLPEPGMARASWNCILGNSGPAALTYHMNRLQTLPGQTQYCVTLNAVERIDPAMVIKKSEYYHPLFTREAIAAQGRWPEISGQRRFHYCGAYWFYGFHEDGLNSGMRVARSLGVDC